MASTVEATVEGQQEQHPDQHLLHSTGTAVKPPMWRGLGSGGELSDKSLRQGECALVFGEAETAAPASKMNLLRPRSRWLQCWRTPDDLHPVLVQAWSWSQLRPCAGVFLMCHL
ncbi:hypothetical protein FQN60_004718 [Etheostoma spectabile]|uniref:Uncharacterized protein n=1 Tax=Etheostoma spectabile TaxID=54343 RepID=A0A5J5DKI7_9PERO|nr:hypothetical protein FQN60_004718 [Etheostoma spectabile]